MDGKPLIDSLCDDIASSGNNTHVRVVVLVREIALAIGAVGNADDGAVLSMTLEQGAGRLADAVVESKP